MARKLVSKISDKLAKVNDTFTISMYDNGFMFEIGGKDSKDEWKTAKIMCPTLHDLQIIVAEAAGMDRDE